MDYADNDWKNKARQLDKQGKYLYRVKGLNWWEEELPTKEEMNYGLEKKRFNNEVDYIVTHQPPENIMLQTSVSKLDFNEFTTYLEKINNTVKFKKYTIPHKIIIHHLHNFFSSLWGIV